MSSLFVLLAACDAENLLAAEDESDATSDTGTAYDGGVDSADEDSESDQVEAVFYSVGATLRVADGAASTEDAEVSLALAGAEQEDAGCAVPLEVGDLAVAEARDGVLAAWTLPVVPIDETCGVTGFPGTLDLGLGALDPEVRARLGAAGVTLPAESLFGAYLGVDGGDLLAIGYATDGVTDEAADAGLRDGLYELWPLLLVRLPAAEE
jgi:hypothetical protein